MTDKFKVAATHTLVEPVTFEGVEHTTINLRRLKGHDIEAVDGLPEGAKATFALIGRLSGWPPEGVRDLDVADIEAISKIIEGFTKRRRQ